MAWFISFLVSAFWFPSTDWWAAQGFPHLNRYAVAVAALAGVSWIALRALSRRFALKSDSPTLGVKLTVLCPIAAWGITWMFLQIIPEVAYRCFACSALIIAGFGWGLTSELIAVWRGQKVHARST